MNAPINESFVENKQTKKSGIVAPTRKLCNILTEEQIRVWKIRAAGRVLIVMSGWGRRAGRRNRKAAQGVVDQTKTNFSCLNYSSTLNEIMQFCLNLTQWGLLPLAVLQSHFVAVMQMSKANSCIENKMAFIISLIFFRIVYFVDKQDAINPTDMMHSGLVKDMKVLFWCSNFNII